jgi:hypothetical protein
MKWWKWPIFFQLLDLRNYCFLEHFSEDRGYSARDSHKIRETSVPTPVLRPYTVTYSSFVCFSSTYWRHNDFEIILRKFTDSPQAVTHLCPHSSCSSTTWPTTVADALHHHTNLLERARIFFIFLSFLSHYLGNFEDIFRNLILSCPKQQLKRFLPVPGAKKLLANCSCGQRWAFRWWVPLIANSLFR